MVEALEVVGIHVHVPVHVPDVHVPVQVAGGKAKHKLGACERD